MTTASSLPRRDDFVIEGGYVLTLDPALGDFEPGDVYVRDGVIEGVGVDLGVQGVRRIDGRGMIVLPGFVETHWHMWNAIRRGLVQEGPDWGYFPLFKLNQFHEPEDAYNSVRLALAEALNAGITTVHNWANNARSHEHVEAELQAHGDVGLRARYGYGTPPGETTDWAELNRLAGEWCGDGLIHFGVAVAAPAAGPGDETARRVLDEWKQAKAHGLPQSAHVGFRGPPTDESAVQVLADARLLGPDVQLVHLVNHLPAHRHLLAATNTKVSLAPFTEMNAPMGVPPVYVMLEAGVDISFSVDTTAVTNADMFAMMRAAVDIIRARTVDPYSILPRKALEIATMGGARGLGLDGQVGSLTPGKRADLIMVRTTDLNMNAAPKLDPTRLLVWAGQPSNVDTVVVDGRILKRDGKLLALDAARVMSDAAASLTKIRERAQLAPLPT